MVKKSSNNALKALMNTPTNNFGLAKLLKNFVLVGESQQMEEVIKTITL